MGRVILTLNGNKKESLKCKSKKRASEIAGKRLDIVSFKFYEDGQRVPPCEKPIQHVPHSFDELDRMMRQGLI